MYIIGTVGPNVKDRNALKGIIDNGVNILRFNFAHGSEHEFLEFMNMANEIDNNIKILMDLSGTKVRISNKFEYIYKIYDNEEIFFCGEDKYNDILKKIGNKRAKIIPLNLKNNMLLKKGYSEITVKDNSMKFKVLDEDTEKIKVITVSGGIIRKGKGCNIKNLDRTSISLSRNDKRAIRWGLKNKVDIICQSFVEDKEDIIEIKEFINKYNNGLFFPHIWGKIETINGINNIESILKEVDGVVIGRGDLIPETSIEDTPIYEEKIINAVRNEKDKELIIATHLFNTMKSGKMPSICEVESIYNFIHYGVTGFLLAGETSIGKAPIKTVEFLKKLIEKYSDNNTH